MQKDQDESPLTLLHWPRYGVDAPAFPAVRGAVGTVCYLAAAKWRPGRNAVVTAGTVLLAHTGIYLHTTLHGKLRIGRRELDKAGLKVTSCSWTWAAVAARC
ncbi:hypothetical protein [Streptomyces sp. 150FB]|uniref:hypothetical protein n=1 Tax=Streptomyces sp. 150FB TaxID=1576605 RepID=UPI00191C147E|nr:hypothetical protein [Streptomyces sp. 150FB]